MKKHKNVILGVAILIIIIIVIIGIVKLSSKNKEEEQKLSKIYGELQGSQTYYFEMDLDSSNKTIMAKKGDKTIIDQYSKDSHTTTLVKDNTTYFILHDRKEYYVYPQNNIEQNILTDGIKDIVDKEYTSGTEKVKGKRYSYEEYSGSTIFMVSSTLAVSDDEIKTRLYYDKDDNLTYVKTIYGETQELIKTSLKNEVEDSVFEIPSDYAEN